VIRNVASALRRSVRDTDAVIRWGGEEFMVILTKCDAAQAIDLAERMRANVAGYADTQAGQVTISLGLATLQTNETLDALIARCDQALYQSKHAGRNRLTVA
jgi:diguanylate cyclase (GGDEF)-like protein